MVRLLSRALVLVLFAISVVVAGYEPRPTVILLSSTGGTFLVSNTTSYMPPTGVTAPTTTEANHVMTFGRAVTLRKLNCNVGGGNLSGAGVDVQMRKEIANAT